MIQAIFWSLVHYFMESKQNMIALCLGLQTFLTPWGETPTTHWYWFLSNLQLLVKNQFLPVIHWCHVRSLSKFCKGIKKSENEEAIPSYRQLNEWLAAMTATAIATITVLIQIM